VETGSVSLTGTNSSVEERVSTFLLQAKRNKNENVRITANIFFINITPKNKVSGISTTHFIIF
jgi:hypothetical protein